jgi:hypothetical protein
MLALLLAAPAAALPQDGGFDLAPEAPPPEHGKAGTADASPVERGAVETELAYAPSWSERGGAGGFELAAPGHTHQLTAAVTWGALPDVDVHLATGVASTYDASRRAGDAAAPVSGGGLSDLGLGARWRFLHLGREALEVAVIADVVAPAGTRTTSTRLGTSQGFWSARAALVATKDLGAWTVNGELAIETPVSGDAGGLRSVAQANLAAGWQVLAWLQPELELNYERTASVALDAHVLAVTAGVVAPFGAGHRVVAAVQHAVWGQHATQTTGALLAFKTAL